MLHLLVRQGQIHGEHDHHIGILQNAHSGYVVLHARVNRPVFRVHGEKNRAFEPMPLRQDLGEHRQALFAAILPFAADEDDMFPLPGTSNRFVGDRPLLCRSHSGETEEDHEQDSC